MVDQEVEDLSHIYSEGIAARRQQVERSANPYLNSADHAELWDCGWTDQNIVMTRAQTHKVPYDALLEHSASSELSRQDEQEDSDEDGEALSPETRGKSDSVD